jgi:hypothetical protein
VGQHRSHSKGKVAGGVLLGVTASGA